VENRFKKYRRDIYQGFWSQNSDWHQECNNCRTKVIDDWLSWDGVTKQNVCNKCKDTLKVNEK
jgi:hypothetical protein